MATSRQSFFSSSVWRGILSITVFLLLWQLGSMSKVWIKLDAFEWLRNLLTQFGLKPAYLPWIGAVPAPTARVSASSANGPIAPA